MQKCCRSSARRSRRGRRMWTRAGRRQRGRRDEGLNDSRFSTSGTSDRSYRLARLDAVHHGLRQHHRRHPRATSTHRCHVDQRLNRQRRSARRSGTSQRTRPLPRRPDPPRDARIRRGVRRAGTGSRRRRRPELRRLLVRRRDGRRPAIHHAYRVPRGSRFIDAPNPERFRLSRITIDALVRAIRASGDVRALAAFGHSGAAAPCSITRC